MHAVVFVSQDEVLAKNTFPVEQENVKTKQWEFRVRKEEEYCNTRYRKKAVLLKDDRLNEKLFKKIAT